MTSLLSSGKQDGIHPPLCLTADVPSGNEVRRISEQPAAHSVTIAIKTNLTLFNFMASLWASTSHRPDHMTESRVLVYLADLLAGLLHKPPEHLF